jgi:hypothetical protein
MRMPRIPAVLEGWFAIDGICVGGAGLGLRHPIDFFS